MENNHFHITLFNLTIRKKQIFTGVSLGFSEFIEWEGDI